MFGLRPYEVHFAQLKIVKGERVCEISAGKTGSRLAYPIYGWWVDRLGLYPDSIGHPFLKHLNFALA